MRYYRSIGCLLVLLVTLTTAPVSSAEDKTLTDDSIVKLVKGNLSEDLIINIIKTQPAKFDLGVDEILALKTNGVSDKIINEMVLHGQAPVIEAPIATNVPEAVPAILPLLKSSDGQIICEACRTLAVLGDTNTIPSIEPLLKGSDNLKKNGPSLSIVAAMRRSDAESEIRKAAKDAIEKLRAKPERVSSQTTENWSKTFSRRVCTKSESHGRPLIYLLLLALLSKNPGLEG